MIDIPLPDPESVTELLKINLRGVPLNEDVDLENLAKRIKGYSGADITSVSLKFF